VKYEGKKYENQRRKMREKKRIMTITMMTTIREIATDWREIGRRKAGCEDSVTRGRILGGAYVCVSLRGIYRYEKRWNEK
jgi:hypothetical protein